jgi:hypothetical protein
MDRSWSVHVATPIKMEMCTNFGQTTLKGSNHLGKNIKTGSQRTRLGGHDGDSCCSKWGPQQTLVYMQRNAWGSVIG